jgi:hypothetical protein
VSVRPAGRAARARAPAPARARAVLAPLLAGAAALALAAGPARGAGGSATAAPFYANARAALYRIDPSTHAAARVMDLPDRTTDLALHHDGTLYACTEPELWRVDVAAKRTVRVGAFGATVYMNALAFGGDGRLYGASSGDAGLFTVDRATGAAHRLAGLPPGHESAGDLVQGPNGALLLTLHDPTVAFDRLYAFDPRTREGRIVGDLSHDRVYGLSVRADTVVAFTELGEVLAVDPKSAATRLLWTVPVPVWGVVEALR